MVAPIRALRPLHCTNPRRISGFLASAAATPPLTLRSLPFAVGRRGLRSLAELETLSDAPKHTTHRASSSISSAIGNGKNSVSPRMASSSASAKAAAANSIILTLSCPDQQGIVYRVTGFLAQHNMNILDSAQFGDPTTLRFFMRVHASGLMGTSADAAAQASPERLDSRLAQFRAEFEKNLASELKMDFNIQREDQKPRTLIMVSKIGHCLNDILFRISAGTMPIQVPLIVSNHTEYASLAASHNIPFHHLPIDAASGKTKEWQEAELMKLVAQYDIQLVVLARYMQILSPALCSHLSGQIINIHHSFLPSFKGAKPYHQAYERGVKIIGATAHLVTADLDEGPIIDQDVERVGHAHAPSELVKIGADIEARVLSRAVRWMAERRVLANGQKTVVFA
ncbi:Formyltetrahydrofolate deformylase [Tilletiaria anomala UBC 951]|uniref:Formyltetrahydrofolate deformylase n=1 Tax=Tilletiaria anomala (strain ATCC 24038 / CBS 436.72 / UBC 951) TaxID=1037660 RepID=A0A066W382_TILAU|nr:Formyltetrahydrofolate deformylase [Tilletiaria anomala UBC 951]KDN45240.1 Formyltetrahydrofolate deformylase [Tilletiaria anomala UBC 951]